MGQKVSRSLVRALDKGLSQAREQMDQQMRNEAKNKAKHGGFTDPHATIDGFTRGQSAGDPRDQQQEAYLQQQSQSTGGDQDLSKDLLDFLNDVGPLKRTVDKEFTSTRLRESLRPKLLEGRTEEDDKNRQVREMPLMEDLDQHVTKRTTNFSTATAPLAEEFGLTEIQFYEMLTDIKTHDELWTEGHGTERDKEEQMKLIENARKYVELPVIMQDRDNAYLGLHQAQVEVSSEDQWLFLQPATGVKLVLSELLDRENMKTRSNVHTGAGDPKSTKST